VWNLAITADASQSQAAGARLPGAVVTAKRAGVVVGTSTARPDDAYWSFDLDPGSYSLSVAASGFAPAARDVSVASGDNAWASMGVAPQPQAVNVVVVVVDSVTQSPIAGATVTITGHEAQPADAEGRLAVSVPPGSIAVTARGEGYVEKTETRSAVVGEPLDVTIALDLLVVTPGEEEVPEVPDGIEEIPPEGDGDGRVHRVIIKNRQTPKVKGGCASAPAAAPAAALLLPLLLRRRRLSAVTIP
jgi:hypothetical protein